MNIGEFFVRIGVKIEKQELSNFTKSLDNLERNSKDIAWSFSKWAGALVAGYYALDKIVQKTSQLYVDMYNINKQTGLQQQQMYEIQNIARMSNPNASAQDVLQSLAAVQKNLISIRYLGQGNLLPYQMLGIPAMGTDAIQVLDMLRKKAKEPMFQSQPMLFTNLVEQMGFSKELMNMIYLSDKEYEKLKKTKLVPPEGQKDIQELRFAFNRFNIELEYTAANIIANLAPSLKKLLDYSQPVINFLEHIGKAFSSIINFISESSAAKIAIVGIVAALSPLAIALSAIALAVDDIMTYFEGGDSITGTIVDISNALGDLITDKLLVIAALWNNLWGNKDEALLYLNQIGDKLKSDTWKELMGFKDPGDKDFSEPKRSWGGFGTGIGMGNNSWFSDFITGLFNRDENHPFGQMLMPTPGNPTTSYYNPNVNNTYYITGENSDLVGKSISEHTQRFLQYGYGQTNTGVLA